MSDLIEGSVYFFVNFVDEDMLIPTMETVIYAGKNLAPGDTGKVYFQDIDSFRRGVRFDTARQGDHAVFQSGSEQYLGHVFTYEKALDVLIACLLRRRNRREKSG